MPIQWIENDRGEWRGKAAGYLLTIVYQPDDPEEAWVWAVNREAAEAPVAAGYEVSLDAARASAERAALGS